MLVVETLVRIRREYTSGKPMKAIARDLRLSRKVVRKAVRAPEGGFTADLDHALACQRQRAVSLSAGAVPIRGPFDRVI